jgi:hypothetical protein
MIEKELAANLREKFLGKICTILTAPTTLIISTPVEHSNFFTGKIEYIDHNGIWLLHLHTNTYSFYAFPIIGIIEEQVIQKNDPRAEKIKEELKKKEQQKAAATPPPQNFIPIDTLTKMVKESK